MTRKTKGFEKLGRAIIYKDRPKKIDESFWKYKALTNWERAVVDFFSEAKDLTRATDLKNGVLFVASLSKELTHRLKLFAEKILESLNHLLGRRVVYALVVED